MKKIFFILIFISLPTNQFYAQCVVPASNFGNKSSVNMYNVLGSVNVTLNSATSVSVTLGSDFSTAAGPDVRIFLVDRGALTNAQLKTPSLFNSQQKIEMGMDPASQTIYTKDIPAGINIADFDTVYFYCQAFNQFWDFGSFAPFTATNCAPFLAINTVEKSNLNIFPNPVISDLNFDFESSSDNFQIKIYTILGSLSRENLVYKNNKKIDISNLESGIYLIELTDEDSNRIIKRFVKR